MPTVTNTPTEHIMSEHFKHVLREFRQAVMDARGDVLSKHYANELQQKKLRRQQDIIQQTFLNGEHLAAPLAFIGVALSVVVGHTVFDSVGAGALTVGTVGLGGACALLLKREMVEQQLSALGEDVKHFLEVLQPLRGSEHCAEMLRETTALLNSGSLSARTLQRLEILGKKLVCGYHEDIHQQKVAQHNQQLMNDLLTPLPPPATVGVERVIVPELPHENTDDRRHLHL